LNLTSDYFLLYHGTHVYKKDVFKIRKELDLDVSALILTVDRNSCSKFLALKSFEKISLSLTDEKPTNIYDIYQIQFNIIEMLKSEDFNTLNKNFLYLKENEILSAQNSEKLLSLFEPIKDTIEEKEYETTFEPENSSKQDLEKLANELKVLITTQEYIDDLDTFYDYLHTQKFSIGITGVMNAGKSTLLNALIGKEVLGTSTIPETANLTVISYDANPSAKVFYWSEKEWQQIEKSAQEVASLKEFVEQTSEHFGSELKEYIQATSKVDIIDVDDLAQYTSAVQSDKKSNLVKYVEVGANLDFLSDGIEIVDTPGLDDLVVQREEITKEYLSNCDLMMHLMNVGQSATQKDVEFIIDAVLYQNVSKLLVVLTRADSVSKKDLEEVIEYTKTSIKTKLLELNKSSQLENILSSLRFMSVSAKMALLHRTGKAESAIEAGYTLEKTGILEIEEYLYKTLYGKTSEKNELFLNSAKYRLIKIVEGYTESLNYQLELLGKNDDELEDELQKFQEEKKNKLKIVRALEEDISFYKSTATKYLESLESFLDSEIIALQSIIKNRLVDDVRYTLEKDKSTPPIARIKVIVDTALKDGLIDIIRDYRYKFIKKTETIAQNIEQKYQDDGLKLAKKSDNFNVQELFSEHFNKSFSASNSDLLVSKIGAVVSKTKLSKISDFDSSLQNILSDELESMQEKMKEKASGVSYTLINSFFENIGEPLKEMNRALEQNEKVLKEQIKRVDISENEKEDEKLNIHKKTKKLESILKRVQL